MLVRLEICQGYKNIEGVDLGKTRFGSTACNKTYRVQIQGFDREDQLIAASLTKPFFSSRYVEVGSRCGSVWLNKNSFKQRFSRDAQSLEKLREVLGDEIDQGIVPDREALGPQLIRRNELASLIKQCSTKAFSNRKLDDIIQTASMENGEPKVKAKKANRSILGNRYLLMTHVKDGDRLVGQGGFGSIKLAIDLNERDIRAVKIVKGDLCEARESRLQDEIRFLRKLRDRSGVVNTKKIQSIDKSVRLCCVAKPRQCYMVMEYWDGGDLFDLEKDVLGENQQQLSFPQKLVIAHDIALGLANVHKAGIAHVDLKEENILLRKEAGKWRACIADFGLARAIGDQRVVMEGTEESWSPEKRRALENQRRRSFIAHDKDDIWALGMIFLSLFDDKHGSWPDLNQYPQDRIDRTIDRHMPEAVRPVLKQMLRNNPDERPDMDAIVAQLSAALIAN